MFLELKYEVVLEASDFCWDGNLDYFDLRPLEGLSWTLPEPILESSRPNNKFENYLQWLRGGPQ